jgi:hypothetical protein
VIADEKNMKNTITAIILASFLLSAKGEEPALRSISGEAALVRRVALIEEILQIKPKFWDLVLPKEYSATVIFCDRSSSKARKEISLEPGSTFALYFASTSKADIRNEQFQFGLTGKYNYTSVLLPRGARTIRFNELDGTKTINLFEVFSPNEDAEPIMWCEIHFQKK